MSPTCPPIIRPALVALALIASVRASSAHPFPPPPPLTTTPTLTTPIPAPAAPADQRCGWFALQSLALHSPSSPTRVTPPPPPAPLSGGFSLSDLQRLAPTFGLELRAIHEPDPSRWPVPSVVHWQDRHFSALVGRNDRHLLFDDCAASMPVSLDVDAVSRTASGFLLVPIAPAMNPPTAIPPQLAAAIRGGQRVYPPVPRDDDDEPCPADEQASAFPHDPDAPIPPDPTPCPGPESCPPGQGDDECSTRGMPAWRVSEPFINLWVTDTPLFYTMSSGRILPFTLRYKQRGSSHSTNVFGCGNHWECSWLSYFQMLEDGALLFRVPGGGRRRYDSAYWGEERGRFGELVSVSYSSNGSISYHVDFASFCFNNYATRFPGTDGSDLHLLTEKKDPCGRTLRFNYATNESLIRLQSVIDYDGRTSTLDYTNRLFPRFITAVRDPYGRSTLLGYDTNGNLVQIVDALGITNSFRYDTNGFLTHLVTPYGTTRFRTWEIDSGDPAFPLRRSILVTLPNGERQAYEYHRDISTACVPEFYGDAPGAGEEIPEGLNTGPLNTRVTFHWDPSQMRLVTNTWPAFDPQFYRLARWRHWDMYFNRDGPAVSSRLLMERLPSPDGIQEGQRFWYAYTFDFVSGIQTSFPSFAATRLPEGTVRYTRWTRNAWGRPTQIEETFSVGDNLSVRQTLYYYDGSDRNVLEIWGPAVDEWGQPTLRHSFLYNASNQITNYCNALGESTRIAYHPANRNLLGVTHPFGLCLTNQLGADGFPIRRLWKNAAGSPLATNSFAWQAGKLARFTDARSQTVTNSWDQLGRLTSRAFPDGTCISNVYAKLDHVPYPESNGDTRLLDRTAFKDRLNHWTTFTFSPLRQPLTRTDPLGGVTRYSWCTCGSLGSSTDPLGQTTRYDYDLQGRLIALHPPTSTPIHIHYDPLGQPTNITDGATSASLGFNHQGLWNSLTLRDGQTETASFDILDRLEELRSARSGSHRFRYDALDRLLDHQSFPDGTTESIAYSPNLPWPTASTNALLTNVVQFAYDPFGRLIQRTFGTAYNGAFTPVATNRFTYDAAGALTRLVDGLNRATSWHYDRAGRPWRKINALGQTVWTNAFNANGWLTERWTPAHSNLTRYAYDALGNLTNIDFSLPTTPDLAFAYDANGRLLAMSDAVGTTRFTWDPSGSFAAEDGPWPDDTVALQRQDSPPATLLSILQPGTNPWLQTNRYDSSGRLAELASPAGTFAYSYLPGTPLAQSIALPNGALISNRFDGLGRLLATTLAAPSGAILNQHAYRYNPAHYRTRQSFSDGHFIDYQHDALGQLAAANSWETPATPRPHETVAYRYDPAGNLTQRICGAAITTWSLDSLNRLASASRNNSITVSGFTSAAATSVAVNGSPAAIYADHTFAHPDVPTLPGNNTFVAVAQDALGRRDTNSVSTLLPTSTTFRYDPNGNLVADDRRSFTYDACNQLVAILVTNGPSASTLTEFVYDALGRRRISRENTWTGSAWTPTAETRYVYAGPLVVQERDPHNSPSITYTRGPDLGGGFATAGGIGGLRALSQHSAFGPRHFYYHADGAGNVTAILDSNQSVAARYAYDPFGVTLAMTGPLATINPYRFSSKEFHPPSSLSYFGARFYDATFAKWLQCDLTEEASDINTYRMVANRPISEVDPYGFELYLEYGAWPLPPGPNRYMYGTRWYENLFICPPHNLVVTFDNTCFWTGMAIITTLEGVGDTISAIESTLGIQGLTESLPMSTAATRGFRSLKSLRHVKCPRPPLVYRRGTLPNPDTKWEGNYIKGKCWALEHPLTTPDFEKKYGLPAENAKPEWVVEGRVKGRFLTRPSPPGYNKPENTGGALEIYTEDPNSVILDWFHMPD